MEKLDEATSHPTRSPAEKILTGHPEDGNQVAGKKLGLIIFISLAIASCGGGDGGGDATLPAVSSATSATQFKHKRPRDDVPPTVISTIPANHATGVAVNAVIAATFSEEMDASTVTTATFTLNDGVTTGAVTYSGTTATFTPTGHLAYSTAYTATITSAVKDEAGNAMTSTYTWSFTTGTAPVITNKLNDTGVTDGLCSMAGSYVFVSCTSAEAIALSNAQDGMVGRDADAATNDNADGKLGFSYASVTGGCVQDNVTGLMWEVKTPGGLRGWTNTYTNYGDNRAGDASAYSAAVNAANLCGYSDWRLPTADELQSIVDYGVPNPGPTIDTDWFPNTGHDWPYWTASPTTSPIFAWTVAFLNGTVSEFWRGDHKYVRLVRAGKSQTPPRYTVSADGQEVTDNNTGLIWRRCVEGMSWNGSTCTGDIVTYTQDVALRQAASLASSSGSAWRLPNVKELFSIVDTSFIMTDNTGIIQPPIDPVAFPATPINRYWSATPSNGITGAALSVHFIAGNVWVLADRNRSSISVRLVRDGQ